MHTVTQLHVHVYQFIYYKIIFIDRLVWRQSDIVWYIGSSYQENLPFSPLLRIYLVSYGRYIYSSLIAFPPVPVSGTLSVKTDNLLFIKLQSWSEGFFQLIDGVLHHFNSVVSISYVFTQGISIMCL